MNVIGYIRVSSDKQDLQKQEHLLLRHAQQHDLQVREFINIEVSSRKGTKERRIDELLDRLSEGDILLVAELSRLGRNMFEVINIINPVAAYITEGFKQYGDSFSPTLHEEWEDTQAQLGQATTLYGTCNERMAAGEYDEALFLDLEEVWQLLVKTGVAGVRTKSMIDSELAKLKG